MIWITLAILLSLVGVSPVMANPWLDLDITERNDGGHFTLQCEAGSIVTKTARILDLGDSYIAADNHRYQVVGFDGDIIQVRQTELIELPAVSDLLPATPQPTLWQRLTGAAGTREQDNNWNIIGIYHTHNAESYVPTSGVESKDRGDILEVGRVFADALEADGYEVIFSDQSHLPHDGEAYARSRRTVVDMLEKQPATLIDIHRDATPPEVYETEIEGQPATKVRIVVGRQNQNRAATMEYAKRIKAVADELYPDLIEGIFDARGNYNQDLAPRAILLEFGAHTNSLEEAQQAAEFFAKVIPAAAGLTGPGEAAAEDRQVGGAARRSILWLVAITALLAVGFVVLNKQGIGSLKSFLLREMRGNVPQKDGDEDNEDKN